MWIFERQKVLTKFHNQMLILYEQLGTLGAGNHYAEIQVVDEIYNEFNARKMGIEYKGQVGTFFN